MIRDIITPRDVAEAQAALRKSQTVSPVPVEPDQDDRDEAVETEPDDELERELRRGERGPMGEPAAVRPRKPRAPRAAKAPADAAVAALGSAVEGPDNWYKKLLKYTPAEAIAFYLALDGLCRSGAEKSQLRMYLWGALALAILFSWLFLTRVWKVKRLSLKLLSTMSLLAYVCGIGGVFATFDGYRPWFGTAAVLIMATFVGLWEPQGTIQQS